MDDVRIHTKHSRQATWVPNYFIDNYMCDANGEYVKVYIYLLRCLSDHRIGLSIPVIAEHLDITEKDVTRALKYWEKLHLVQLEFNSKKQLIGICLLDQEAGNTDRVVSLSKHNTSSAASTAGSGTPNRSEDSAVSAAPREDRPQYSAEQMNCFKEDEDVAAMLYAVSNFLGHILSQTDLNTILYWLDGLGFTPDLIEYLVDYCINRNHNSIYYMDKVAMNWASNGITTVEAAKESANLHSRVYYAVCNAFGISGRNLNDRELSYISRWTNEFGFSSDIISEACLRTIANINKPNFEYAHRILKDWHSKGVRKTEDIIPLDSAHAASAKKNAAGNTAAKNNRFHQFSQGDYDMDALESALIHNN